MAINWSTVTKESEGQGIKALVYGPAGTGKTRLCGTAPAPMIISAEAGLLTLKQLIAEGRLHPDTPVSRVTDIASVEETYEWVKVNGLKNGVQTLCLDSISEITEVCLQNEKSKTKDPRAAYGEMAGKVVTLIKKFRDLRGFHVLVTAKETHRVDPVSGVSKSVPKTPGQQVGPDLPYLFDLVLHSHIGRDTTTGDNYYALRTSASFEAEAKDRSGVLDVIEYPDFTHLVNKIMATKGEQP